MIYTYTLNPAIDYYMQVDQDLMDTEVNRAKEVILKAAGKGINVSAALDAMGIDSTAAAVLGGFTGNFIKEHILSYKHIRLLEIPVEGANRINVKIHQEHKALCVNAKGPKVDEKTKEKIFSCLNSINASDYVMICGSMMKGFDEDFIYQLSMKVHDSGAKLILDMESLSFELLKKCRPYLIKPNLYEFKMLMKQEEMPDQQLDSALYQANQAGIENVLLSLGKEGALLQTSDGLYRMTQKEIEAVNQVGCGDAMLAAFTGKISEGSSMNEALRFAGAAGCAAVSSFDDLTLERINEYLPKVKVKQIK